MIFGNRKSFAAALGCAAFAGAAQARAALSFSTGATSSFSVAPGNSINVPIYLRDTAGAIQIATDGGLFSAGFLVQQSAPIPAASATITAADSNPASFDTLDTTLSSYSATSAGISEYQTNNPNPATPVAGLLQLGTLTIKAPTQPGQTTQYTIGDLDPNSTQVVDYDGDSLDASIASGAFSVTSSSIPEPSAISLLFACCGSILLLSRLRSRSTKPEL